MAEQTAAEKAQDQADVKKTFESEQTAVKLTAEEARQNAIEEDKKKGLVHGVPKADYDKMDLGQQKRAQLSDVNSSLVNQETNEDLIDFHILKSTPAFTIAAMTSKTVDELAIRAKELNATLKDVAAGNFRPGQG